MAKITILDEVRNLGKSRAEISSTLRASPLAPNGKELSPSALGMWFTRGHVPHMWHSAVLERLVRIEAVNATATGGSQ